MAARILAQIIVAGSQIVGKAFMEAYRQAAANAAKNGGHQAAKSGGGGGSKSATADALTRKSGMSVDEAMNILNITKETDLEKINYQHLYKVNDKAVNGSFYLQSKVVRAKERLEMEWASQGNPMKIEAEVPEPAAPASGASGSGSGSGPTDATSKTSEASDAKSTHPPN
ncbi:mitochondrial import inner membrane translocase subunit TIM16 [Mortierella sp. NVP85]|nr:mitochondrial import inner membrane translocase subunit TIM16 [Mortierella sp. NVP85]